jgi:hypothetical protein
MRKALIAGVAAAVLLAGCTSSHAPSAGRSTGTPATGSTATAIPSATGSPLASVSTDLHETCGLARSTGALWALGCNGLAVRIPDGGKPPRTIDLDGDVQSLDGITTDGVDTVWILLSRKDGDRRRGIVLELDASTGSRRSEHRLGSSIPAHAAYDLGRLWIATLDGRLILLKGNESKTIASGPPLMWVVVDGDRMWTVAENGDVTLRRSADGALRRKEVGRWPGAIAAGGGLGRLWLAPSTGGVVSLDGLDGRTDEVAVTGTVNDIELCDGKMWLSQPDFGLRAVRPPGAVVQSIGLGAAPRYLRCDRERLYVLSEDGKLGSIDPS